MTKKLALLVLAVAGLASIAATCVFRNDATTDIGGDAVYGAEVRNETGANFLGHRFVVAFLNDDLEVMKVQTVEGCLRSLQANATNFFSADSGEDFDDVEVVLRRLALDSSLKVGTTVDGKMIISDQEATRNGDELVVTGNIENDSGDDLEDVRVCVVVYNDDDDVQVVARDNNLYDLDDGDDVNFSITLEVSDDDDDTHLVDIWADAINADEDDGVTKPQSKLGVAIEECDPAATNTPTPGAGTDTATATNTPTATTTPPTATNTPVDSAC